MSADHEPLAQPRRLVAPELRNVDFNPPTDSPFGSGGSSFTAAFDFLAGGRAPMPVLTAWGLLADRAYAWSFISSIEHRVHAADNGRSGDQRPERISTVEFLAAGCRYHLAGPFMPMLEGLPQLWPQYQSIACRTLALDLAGARPLVAGPSGAFLTLVEAAKRAAEPLVENVSGYREHRAKLSREGRAALTNALTLEPDGHDPGMLAAVVAALLGATDLADEVSQCILSPNPLFAATAKVAAGKLGMGPIVTGQLSEVAPFLYPADVQALHAWSQS